MKSKKLKKLLAIALITSMLFGNGMMSQAFAKEVTVDDETIINVTGTISGECGDNLTWTLDDGTLTISGSGEMYDYLFYEGVNPPWRDYDFNCVIIKEGVTSIGAYAFENCSSLSSVSIPEGVASIGTFAFGGCSSLSSISIPKGVWYIGESAFARCSSLSSINIPEGVTSIGDNAFNGCSSLNSISIPNSVTKIGESTFYNCSGLSSINIPEGVTSIGRWAFYNCSGLSSISIPEEVMEIGDNAFSGCSSLSSINVSEDNEYYCSKDGVLYNKEKTDLIQYPVGKSDTMFSIPEGVISIGDGVFSGCSSLNSISIPESVTAISDSAFSSCGSLSSINVSEDNKEYSSKDGVFYNKEKTYLIKYPEGKNDTMFSIPEGITRISDNAFSSCSNLSGINVSEDNEVYSSKDGVLYNKRKTDLIRYPEGKTDNMFCIPDGVTRIGWNAFQNCRSLCSIIILEEVTSMGIYAFSGCSNLTIYCYTDSTAHRLLSHSNSGISYILIDASETDINKGACGENLTWTLDEEGMLIISGSGDMYDYSRYWNPWRKHDFSKIIIEENVTSIGKCAFLGCSSFSSISIPNSVTSIGDSAFQACSSLNSISIPNSVTSIGYSAFLGCSSLSSINIPEGVTSIGNEAFLGCSSLSSINIPEGGYKHRK